MANDRRVGNLLVQMRAEIGGVKTDIKELEKTFQTGFTGIQNSAASAFANVGKSIVGAFSVTAIISFSKSIIDLGGRLQDLQEQTHISAQLLSGMKSVIEENGSTLDAFAKGIFTAQKNLGQIDNDTDKAAIAIKQLGLNLNELRNATPEQFLESIAEALSKIENPVQRAAAGAAILGRQYQELAPVLNQLTGRFEEFRAKGLTPEDIKLLDEAGDAWTRLANKVTLAAASIFTDAIRTFESIKRLVNLNLQGLFKGAGAGATIGAVGGGELEEALAGAGKPEQKAVAPFIATAGKPKKNATDDFVASLQKQADALRVSLKELAQGETAAKAYALELELAAFKSKLLADNKPIPADLDKRFREAAAALQTLQRELTAAKREAELLDAATKRDDQDRAEWLTFEADLGRITLAAQDAAKAFEQMRLKELGDALDQDSQAWATAGKEIADIVDKKQGDKITKEWQSVESVIRAGAGTIQTAFDGVIQGTQSIGEAFRNMGLGIALSMSNAITQLLVIEPLIESLKKSFSLAGGLGGLFGGGVQQLSGPALEEGFLSSIVSGIGRFLKFDQGGVVPGRIGAPRLAMVHGGETITPPAGIMSGGKPNVNVSINGSIIPNPGVTRDQVIQIGMEQFNNRGKWTQMYESRRSRN